MLNMDPDEAHGISVPCPAFADVQELVLRKHFKGQHSSQDAHLLEVLLLKLQHFL